MAQHRIFSLPGRGFWSRMLALFLLLLGGGCAGETTAVISPTAVAPASFPLPTATHTATAVPPTTAATAASTPTFALTATATATATTPSSPTPTRTPTITPIPPEALVNGLLRDSFIVMDAVAQNHVRDIFARGQALGRDAGAFSKVGDSIVLTPHYLTRFDGREYNLGIYADLQPTVDQFAGSFAHFGQAAHVGLSSRTLFERGWADPELCLPDENAIDCEIRLHNPSIFLIRLGTNDLVAESFESNMRKLLEHLLDLGVIPILGTKADRFESETNTNNEILRTLAAEYHLPLWDFDLVAGTLPERGLSGDAIHLTMAGANDYTDPYVLEKGYAVSDLTALMALDSVRRVLEATP